MARIPFTSAFSIEEGRIRPRQRIRIGGVVLESTVSFTRDTSVAGVELGRYIENDLDIETEGDTLVITGIYEKVDAA